MKYLKFKPPEYLLENFRWGDDVQRIISICYDRGYVISEADAQAAWEEYSDSMAASWLYLDDDADQVFTTIMEYCEEFPNANPTRIGK